MSLLYFHCFLCPKQRKLPKICLSLKPPAKRKKIGTDKSKVLADAIVEEVDFLCVSSNEKKRTDMKLVNACVKQGIEDMKQETADMKLEKAAMKLQINTLTFGLQCFTCCNDDIQFYTVFSSYFTLTSFYEFLLPSATLLNYKKSFLN